MGDCPGGHCPNTCFYLFFPLLLSILFFGKNYVRHITQTDTKYDKKKTLNMNNSFNENLKFGSLYYNRLVFFVKSNSH